MGASGRYDWWFKISMQNTAITALLLLLLASCQFKPNVQEPGTAMVQGNWEEIPVAYQDSLLQYTRHQFRFSCDSFYLQMETSAKSNPYPDSCFNNGHWTEYVKGTYRQGHDTLYLDGTFTKANWKQKISGCYRLGRYLNALVLKQSKGDTLEVRSIDQHIPIKLLLKEAFPCEPKPLN